MIQLIPDWKEAYKWASVRFVSLATAVQVTWLSIPEDLREDVPNSVVTGITIALLLLGVIGRITMKEEPADVKPTE